MGMAAAGAPAVGWPFAVAARAKVAAGWATAEMRVRAARAARAAAMAVMVAMVAVVVMVAIAPYAACPYRWRCPSCNLRYTKPRRCSRR